MEDELAPAGGGIDILRQAPEVDLSVPQLGDGLDQVLEGAAEAIKTPDDARISLSKVL